MDHSPNRRTAFPRKASTRRMPATKRIIGGLCILLGMAFAHAFAQPVPSPPETAQVDDATLAGLTLPMERTVSRGLGIAQKRIAAGKHAQAIRYLDDVLAREEDVFVEVDSTGNVKQQYQGLKATARRILGSLSPAGRDAYLLAYESLARNALTKAIRDGDLPAVQTISRRYYHTPAGYQATMLLARTVLDQGRPAGAAAMYDQLIETPHAARFFGPQLYVLATSAHLQSGQTERARRVLDRLQQDYPRSPVMIRGKQVNLSRVAGDSLEWLASQLDVIGEPASHIAREWIMYRGDPARNSESDGGEPHRTVRWRVRVANNHRVDRMLEDIRNVYNTRRVVILPSCQPLAVGDIVVMRSTHRIIGVDFRTGKRIWNDVPDENDTQYEQMVASLDGSKVAAAAPQFVSAMTQRMWKDAHYGTLSSDGRSVYGVSSVLLSPEVSRNPFGFGLGFRGGGVQSGGAEFAGPTNRLTAFDIRAEGKKVWEINGEEVDGPLSGAFFLGPPLPVDGRLYVLAEIKGGIHLVAIRPTDRRPFWELDWSQQLANLETGIAWDLRRRLAGVTPSFKDGILVCPTSAGAVVGVDLIQRSLLWAYRYPTYTSQTQDPNRRAMIRVKRGGRPLSKGKPNDCWIDGTAIVAGGRVLLTPTNSNALHCLDLQTGKLLWKHKRKDSLFIACVHDACILLIGQNDATALRLADGKPAWNNDKDDAVTFGKAVMPTGRGFLNEGNYYLPLSNGDIVAIDVAGGFIAKRNGSHEGTTLGNLICHRGAVFSLSERFLDKFDQLDIVKQRIEDALAKNGDDPRALRELGEIAFNDGDLLKATQLLRRAYEVDSSNSETREMLVNCMLTTLEKDYTARRDSIPFLEQLVTSPDKRSRLERARAEGLHQGGDIAGAVRAYIRLAEQDRLASNHRMKTDHWSTIVGRWVSGQLADIWREADTGQRETILRLIGPVEESLGEDPSVAQVRNHLRYFGMLPPSDRWKLLLAEKLLELDVPLESELLLLQLVDSPEEETQGRATAMLAELLHSAGRHRGARRYDDMLAERFANMRCRRGKTGEQMAVEHRARFADSTATARWPNGIVRHQTIKKHAKKRAKQPQSRLQHIRMEGRVDPTFEGCHLFIDQPHSQNAGGSIVFQNAMGHNEITVPLIRGESGMFPRHTLGRRCHAVHLGGLCIVSLGDYLLAIDAFAADAHSEQRVLWDVYPRHHPIHPTTPMIFGSNGYASGMADFGLNGRSFATGQDGLPIGVLGPITSHGVAFQAEGKLKFVDPLTGEEVWSRYDIPSGCLLFGDEHYLFALPAKSQEAIVLRTIDGKRLGVRTVAPVKQHLATYGRTILCWRSGKMELARVDAWTGKTLWSHKASPQVKVWMAENEAVGITDPTGNFRLVSVEDGSLLIEQQIKKENNLNAAYVMLSDDRVYLITSKAHSVSSDGDTRVYPIVDRDYPIVTGHVYAFDRGSGEPAWPCPAMVRQQGLALWQPQDVPVLSFISRLSRRKPSTKYYARLLCLDKASGRGLYRRDNLVRTNDCFSVTVDSNNSNEVSIVLLSEQVKLTWTSEPRSPEPPFDEDVELGQPQAGSRGLFQILRGFL